MSDAPQEPLKPSVLAKAAKISVPYASQIIKDKRVPPLATALLIFKETGHKFGPLKGATDKDVAVMARVMKASDAA